MKYTKSIKKILVFCPIMLLLILPQSVIAYDFETSPFSGKLIFSETPEIGKKWHGGIRLNDIIIFDGYWNICNWLTIDFLRAGINELSIDTSGSEVSDRFSIFTIKSRPFATTLRGRPYKVGGGIKFYAANFCLVGGEDMDSLLYFEDKYFVLFVTQSYRLKEKHYFNLFTSISSREKQDAGGEKKSSSTYYIIPGYKIAISEHWNFAIEYYMTNTERMPLRILQYFFDADKLDFHNRERYMYSFMFFGCHYARKHLRLDLNIASHITFKYLVLPIFGIGWNF